MRRHTPRYPFRRPACSDRPAPDTARRAGVFGAEARSFWPVAGLTGFWRRAGGRETQGLGRDLPGIPGPATLSEAIFAETEHGGHLDEGVPSNLREPPLPPRTAITMSLPGGVGEPPAEGPRDTDNGLRPFVCDSCSGLATRAFRIAMHASGGHSEGFDKDFCDDCWWAYVKEHRLDLLGFGIA